MGVAPGSSSPAGEMKGGVMIAGVHPGIPPCMRTAYPRDKACTPTLVVETLQAAWSRCQSCDPVCSKVPLHMRPVLVTGYFPGEVKTMQGCAKAECKAIPVVTVHHHAMSEVN